MKNILLAICVMTVVNCLAQDDSINVKEDITQADLVAALKLTGLNIYKFPLGQLGNNKAYLLFTIQEFIGGDMTNERELVYITTPFNVFENKVKVEKHLDMIRVIVHKLDIDTSSLSFETEIFGGKTAYKFNTMLNDSFSVHFGSKPFRVDNQIFNEYHPLVMIGSYWKDDSVERFCMDNKLDKDFSSEAFSLMPAYYLVGYYLLEKKR